MTPYQPAEDSFLMREALKTLDCKPKTVLDMGTGSGILAIAAAREGCSVTAVDINPDAIEFAKKAAEKENLKINFILSDLFEKVKRKFDLIVFNPPYVKTEDSETRDMQSIAWDGGPDGLQVINRFLSQVRDHLNASGKILLLVSSNSENPPVFPGFNQKLIGEKKLFFEILFVLELT